MKGKSTTKAIESDESDDEDPEYLFPEDQFFAKGEGIIEYKQEVDISSTVKKPKTGGL